MHTNIYSVLKFCEQNLRIGRECKVCFYKQCTCNRIRWWIDTDNTLL